MKNLLLVLLLFFFTISSRSQYLGGHVGATYLVGFGVLPMVGAHFNFFIKDQPICTGVNFHFAGSTTGSTYANNRFGSGQISVDYTEKVSVLDLNVGWRLYFGHHEYSEGGWYMPAGLGLGLGFSRIIPAPYDQTMYSATLFDPLNTLYYQLYLNIGIGFDKVLDNEHVLGFQFIISIPPTAVNGQNVADEIQMPPFVGLRATYSIPLGD